MSIRQNRNTHGRLDKMTKHTVAWLTLTPRALGALTHAHTHASAASRSMRAANLPRSSFLFPIYFFPTTTTTPPPSERPICFRHSERQTCVRAHNLRPLTTKLLNGRLDYTVSLSLALDSL